MKLIFDTTDLTEEQVTIYQQGILDTLDKLNVDYEYDEVNPDLSRYTVCIPCDSLTVKVKHVH